MLVEAKYISDVTKEGYRPLYILINNNLGIKNQSIFARIMEIYVNAYHEAIDIAYYEVDEEVDMYSQDIAVIGDVDEMIDEILAKLVGKNLSKNLGADEAVDIDSIVEHFGARYGIE